MNNKDKSHFTLATTRSAWGIEALFKLIFEAFLGLKIASAESPTRARKIKLCSANPYWYWGQGTRPNDKI